MSDIWNNNTGVVVNPNEAVSFGGAGQIYNADLFGGLVVSAERVNQVFQFRRTDTSRHFAELLTNLDEDGKIGSTMSFMVTHFGVKIFKLDGSKYTPEEAAAVKFLMASALIEVYYGANKTKVGEFSGQHFLAPIDFLMEESVVTPSADGTRSSTSCANAGAAGASYIKLSEKIQIQKNLQIGGTVRFGATVPTILWSNDGGSTVTEKFGFCVHLYGVKKVDA